MAHIVKSMAGLADYAVIIDENDNVAVVKKAVPAGTSLVLPDSSSMEVISHVPPGHRIALRDIPGGDFVLQYGQPIGQSKGIAYGSVVNHLNMTDSVPVVRDIPERLSTPETKYLPFADRGTFTGFKRGDGRVGTRNYVLVIPTSMCASHEALQISMMAEFTIYSRSRFPNVDGVTAIPHNKGCGCQDGSPVEMLLRVLSNYADHPNVGGVVLLELGCEKTNLSVLEEYLGRLGKKLNKPLVRIGIQQVGGTHAAIQAGLAAVTRMLPEVNECRREAVSVSELVLGLKCGGSDAFSGLSANPSLGAATDLLVCSGGTALMTEVPEFCGAEHVLAHRAKDAETGPRGLPHGRLVQRLRRQMGREPGRESKSRQR